MLLSTLEASKRSVAIIGGGPSLSGFDFTKLRGRGYYVIAVNNAYKVAPWADLCFFADARWWRHHKSELLNFEGSLVTSTADHKTVQHSRLVRLQREYNAPLSEDPTKVSGHDSGTMAVNLAYLMGARRIVLLGFDMTFEEGGPTHWHDEHIWPTRKTLYEDRFKPKLAAMVEVLKAKGLRVTRATNPGVPNVEYCAL